MAQVSFQRIQNSSTINDVQVVDGQLIYTKDGKQFIDYGADRVQLAGEHIVDTAMSDTSTNAVQNRVIKNYVDAETGDLLDLTTAEQGNLVGAINEVNSTVSGVAGRLLWTNENPTASISSSTTITFNSSDYDLIEVYFKLYATTNVYFSTKAPKGVNARLFSIDGGGNMSVRQFDYVDDTTYTIGTDNTASNRNIPVYVVGYKTGVF